MLLPTLIVQSLGGFEPVTPGYSENSTTQEGALSNFELILSNIIGFMTILAGLFFIFYFLTAVFQIIGAGGDAGKVSSAQQKIMQAVIGLVILVAGYAIIGLVGSVIGLNLLEPGRMLLEVIPGATPAGP